MTSDLFQQLILEHYRRSRHRGPMESATTEATKVNLVCGDEVTIRLKIEDGTISGVRFSGQGCSISQAAASMMAQRLEGRSLEEAGALGVRFREMLRGDAGAASDPVLGDLRALAGVAKLPQRVRCAMLSWDAFEAGIDAMGPNPPPS